MMTGELCALIRQSVLQERIEAGCCYSGASRSYDSAVHWNAGLCLPSVLAAVGITAVFIVTAKGSVPVKKAKKKQAAVKKGW